MLFCYASYISISTCSNTVVAHNVSCFTVVVCWVCVNVIVCDSS